MCFNPGEWCITPVQWTLDGGGLYTELSYSVSPYADVRWALSDTAFYVTSELAGVTGPAIYIAPNVVTPLPVGLPTWSSGNLTIRGAAGATIRCNLYRPKANP